ncbi:MAG: PadR family transcriptional regulator [[Clostridium] innocuum]
MLPSQMMKNPDNCILIVIAQEDTYGYDISQKPQAYGFSDISEVPYIRCCCGWKNGCICSEPQNIPNEILFHNRSGRGEIQAFLT